MALLRLDEAAVAVLRVFAFGLTRVVRVSLHHFLLMPAA
jgi:hypothetical protein